MTRRKFAGAAAAGPAALAQPAAQQLKTPAILELRYFRLRNGPDQQMQRTADFLRDSVLPAVQRSGGGAMGFFAPIVGEDMPFVLAVTSYPSLASIEAVAAKMAGDRQFSKELEAFSNAPGLRYAR